LVRQRSVEFGFVMKYLLKNVTEIQPGFSFRGKFEPAADGEYRVLQIKDIGANGRILTDELTRTDHADLNQVYLVKKDDILFTTRGANRRAAFVAEEIPNTIFVAQIYSLRSLKEEIDPAYLAWYLNQKPAQDFFEAYSSGSYIKNIKIDVLKNLEIEVPPVEKQKKIVEIDSLRRQENELVESIQTKRNQVIEQTLINAIKGD